VPAMLQWHTCVSRRSSTCKQETLRFAEELAWRTNPALSSRPMIHDIQQFLPLVDRSIAIPTNHHGDYSFSHLPPTATLPGKLLRHPRNLITVKLFSSPILFTAGIHFPRVLLHNQGYPKVCPDSLNLLNAGDSFAGISSLTSCYLFSRPGT
jgi:hypothetical protein